MSGYVYFITGDPLDFVKIGWAKSDPFARLKNLQTGCPNQLFVATYFRGTVEDERRLHRTFEFLNYRSEWFIKSLKLSDFIDYLTDFGERLEVECPRQRFEDAVWDVLVSGFEYPDREDLEIYKRSADAREWHFLFPEEDLVG